MCAMMTVRFRRAVRRCSGNIFLRRSLDPLPRLTGDIPRVSLRTPDSGCSLSDFTTLVGRRTANRAGWALYTFELPEGTRYFAIHVISVNCYALFVDDITYEAASAVVEGYNVYRDGKLLASVVAPGYTDIRAGGSHAYFVGVRYDRGESGASNEVVISTSVPAGIYLMGGRKIAVMR